MCLFVCLFVCLFGFFFRLSSTDFASFSKKIKLSDHQDKRKLTWTSGNLLEANQLKNEDHHRHVHGHTLYLVDFSSNILLLKFKLEGLNSAVMVFMIVIIIVIVIVIIVVVIIFIVMIMIMIIIIIFSI